MSTTHHMKMAKASQADIDAAIQLHQFLRAMSQGRSAPEVVDEFGYTGYDDLLERQAADVEFALRAYENGDLFRVVWGMQTLLDPRNEVVDPNLPHLELHPKHEQAARELEALCKAKNEAVDERDEARAEAEQARREGQEIAAGLHEKLAEVRAEAERVAKQRDELLEASKLAIREIRPSTACSMCHDSTWDHECDSKVNTTHVALSNAIKGASAAEQPKPVAWPHLPEVDRPASEVQP